MQFGVERFDSIEIDARVDADAKRVVIRYDGHIDAGGGDNRILVRLNDVATDYQGFVVMDGHAGAGEWDQRGLYVGRNGWGLDAHFSFALTISVMPGRKRMAYGMSSFGHADERILGYTCQSFWANTATPIQNVGFWKVGPGKIVRDALTVVWEYQ